MPPCQRVTCPTVGLTVPVGRASFPADQRDAGPYLRAAGGD